MLGICNGFQILLEAGLLPGAMLRNRDLKFRCEHVHVRVEQTDTPFTRARAAGQVLRIPIAHGEGNYFADAGRARASSKRNRQVVFRYCDAHGRGDRRANPNGSRRQHRRHLQRARNVVGLMPHPERACEPALGSADGLVLFESVGQALAQAARALHASWPCDRRRSSNGTA